uniref:Putative secreted protein n=1 Tax=Ixodes ricinus TaxID=34613 RepID=A0A6B0UPP7_IXORI
MMSAFIIICCTKAVSLAVATLCPFAPFPPSPMHAHNTPASTAHSPHRATDTTSHDALFSDVYRKPHIHLSPETEIHDTDCSVAPTSPSRTKRSSLYRKKNGVEDEARQLLQAACSSDRNVHF